MFEMSYGELFLFVWALGATGTAWGLYTETRKLGKLLHGAASFTERLIKDDKLRDEMRGILKRAKDAEINFGE